MKSGSALIVEERERQKTEENYTAEHDAEHTNEELAEFASFYAHPNLQELYPKTWDEKYNKRNKHSRIRQLTIAGALCAAEIDRLQREGLK